MRSVEAEPVHELAPGPNERPVDRRMVARALELHQVNAGKRAGHVLAPGNGPAGDQSRMAEEVHGADASRLWGPRAGQSKMDPVVGADVCLRDFAAPLFFRDFLA